MALASTALGYHERAGPVAGQTPPVHDAGAALVDPVVAVVVGADHVLEPVDLGR